MADVFGLEVADLPEGWTPIRVLAVVECLVFDPEDEGSARKLCLRAAEGTLTWDMLGMLKAMLIDVEQQYREAMVPDE